MDGSDATGGDDPSPIGDVVVDVRSSHHRRGSFNTGLILDALGGSPLALVELVADSRAPSKTSCLVTV